MHWIDWLIVIVPLVAVTWVALRAHKYVQGVADFLTAGRVAGRYVLCVSGGEAAYGLISLVAVYESYYASGFAYGFWGSISAPIFIVLGLTGFCVYRFRETRAMTVGQFLEIRYSRSFRVFAGVLQSISGIINYALFPAVGARFLVYFCGLPIHVDIFGWYFPTFGLLMALNLSLAVLVATKGGQITIMVTNCVQGLLSYPVYVIIVGYVLWHFSWFRDMAPALLDRDPGKSLINPFDISGLRDFNLFYVLVGILGGIVNRLGWSGNQGYSVSARNAHEQKMAGVLGSWRGGFESMMYLLLAVVAMAYLNSDKFQDGEKGAIAARLELAIKAVNDVADAPELTPVRQEVVSYLNSGTVTPELQAMLDKTAALKAKEEADRDRLRYTATESTPEEEAAATTTDAEARMLAREARMQVARDAIQSADPSAAQTFNTIFGQMRVPMALRYILPMGITGLFLAILIFHMVSVDMSYLLSWGSILVQDIVLPLRKTPFTPEQQLRLLRYIIAAIAVFAFFFSYFFGQVDYVLMFFAITGAIWLGGSGPCITGGLYWKRGSTAGAWAALISGSSIAVAGILLQKYWVGGIYPWLYDRGWVDAVAVWLQTASSPFEPLVTWRMSSEKFPINSQEVYAIGMIVSLGLYIAISLVTSRGERVFNMDRMLHRGIYQREEDQHVAAQDPEEKRWTAQWLMAQLIGIDHQYTRTDRWLAWSVFIYSFGWGFVVCFLGVIIWNFISPWSNADWSYWFYFNNFLVAGAIGVVSTVWFTIGGTMDLRQLFVDLDAKQTNVLDDGRVIGHISADDVALVERVEQGGAGDGARRRRRENPRPDPVVEEELPVCHGGLLAGVQLREGVLGLPLEQARGRLGAVLALGDIGADEEDLVRRGHLGCPQPAEKGLAGVLPGGDEGMHPLVLGGELARAETAEEIGQHLQAALAGKAVSDVQAQVLGEGVEVIARVQRHLGGHLEIVPVVRLVAHGRVVGPGVDQAFEFALGSGLGQVEGAHHTDGEGQHWMGPHHRQVDGRVHTFAGCEHLLVLGDIHHAVLVWRTQQFGHRRPRPLRRGGRRDLGHGFDIGHPQRVMVL